MKTAKAMVAAAGSVVSVLTVAFADEVFNASEVAMVIAALIEAAITVYAVWRTPNTYSAKV